MAKSSSNPLDQKIKDAQNQQGQLDPKTQADASYNPGKRKRAIRRQVYQRFYAMRDSTFRVQAEADWEIADKEFGMVVPERDPRDPDAWRADLHLPDAWAAIQAQAQETIERKSRPHLVGTEVTDEPKAEFCNSLMTYNMNNTGFDYQYSLAKLAASYRGTAFLVDYWRTEKRTVKDPVGLKEDGTIKYESKEIIDFDDDYTEFVPNEYIHIDEKAAHIEDAIDCVRREILEIDEFRRKYGDNPYYFDVDFVSPGGDTTTRSYFQMPGDILQQEVEILHYENRSIDAYWCVANNVTICDSPLLTKHKELSPTPIYQYRMPGHFWGIGIPKVVHFLSEERRSIRNLNMDRQKLQINKMFLHNNAFDIDDEDMQVRPNGVISVDTNGQPISQAMVPLEYGDVAPSYFRTEEILLEDIRRAHGIDDRIQGVNVGGTATEAAILKESALKRVNLISISNEMDSIVRIGRLKWSNIQFFYGTPRMEKIVNPEGEEEDEKVYRTISVQGKKFDIDKDEGTGRTSLKMSDIKGASAIRLDKKFAKYLQGDFDISVDSDVFAPVSKAIEQTKKTELFGLLVGNPITGSKMDITGAMTDVLKVNNIHPEVWLKTDEKPIGEQMMQAEAENIVMAAGQPLSGTQGATTEHTLIHVMFSKTKEFEQLSPEIQGLFINHIMEEHENNPNTGSVGDLLGGGGGAPAGPGGPAAGQAAPLAPGAAQLGGQPQAQVADLQPTDFSNRANK